MYGGRVDVDYDLLQKLKKNIDSLERKKENARDVDERKKYNYHLRVVKQKRNEIWQQMEYHSRPT